MKVPKMIRMSSMYRSHDVARISLGKLHAEKSPAANPEPLCLDVFCYLMPLKDPCGTYPYFGKEEAHKTLESIRDNVLTSQNGRPPRDLMLHSTIPA